MSAVDLPDDDDMGLSIAELTGVCVLVSHFSMEAAVCTYAMSFSCVPGSLKQAVSSDSVAVNADFEELLPEDDEDEDHFKVPDSASQGVDKKPEPLIMLLAMCVMTQHHLDVH